MNAFLNFKIVKLIGTSKLDSIPKFFIFKMGHVVYFIKALSSELCFLIQNVFIYKIFYVKF